MKLFLWVPPVCFVWQDSASVVVAAVAVLLPQADHLERWKQ